jgi:hypothetical protein
MSPSMITYVIQISYEMLQLQYRTVLQHFLQQCSGAQGNASM